MRLKNAIVMSALLCAAGAAVYKWGLTEEARESVRSGARSAREAWDAVTSAVEDAMGVVVDDGSGANREQAQRDWEALGY